MDLIQIIYFVILLLEVLNSTNIDIAVQEFLQLNVKNFKKVYTGHIHTSQDYKNICYVGNPYQMTRSDTNNMKGFRCLDFSSGEEQFFENTYSPKFVKIYINKALENKLEDIIKVSTNNFVDVYVPNEYLMKYK